MTKYIQDKDGKFAGSIGDGKTNVPTTPAAAPKSPWVSPLTTADIDRQREELAAVFAAREQARTISDTARKLANEIIIEEIPGAAWLTIASSDRGFAATRITDRDGADVWTPAQRGKVTQAMVALAPAITAGLYTKAQEDGSYRILLTRPCGIDGCTFGMPANGSFAPMHGTPRPGHPAHCTCDFCF